jgi:hypothetical protein
MISVSSSLRRFILMYLLIEVLRRADIHYQVLGIKMLADKWPAVYGCVKKSAVSIWVWRCR